jgi:sugar/nucleoside kinase (ribokinase family)
VAETNRPADPPSVVVAGHICLDIIPQLPPDLRRRALSPGSLDLIGPVTLAVGGCVGNTGIALHRLGVRSTLIARVGDDRLGSVLSGLVREAVPGDAARLVIAAGEPTSYSLVSNLPGRDRSIQHFPGVNDTFVADDVPLELLRGATALHVGYPPLMAALVADDGRELGRLLATAHGTGVATSLDMANANLDPGEGGVRWRQLLAKVLPDVDVFLPSLAEACHLLGRRVRRDEQGAPTLASVARLADEMIGLGVRIAGVKLGEHGFYVRTASTAGVGAGPIGRPSTWADRELYSSVFESHVVGTAGAGDATIAGFLFGMLTQMSIGEAVTAACAVGGSSTEAADGTSSVPGWADVERRLREGWRRSAARPGAGWAPSREQGLWYGPRDAVGSVESEPTRD